ncbi:MAG TPA: lamin tail domain-containing protein, partial [Candidatus Binatia bacterium]|nr:lamin tail domain-containing protein [Candidatus Binatia bacterium]
NAVSSGGTRQDLVAFGLQISDLSISRVPDGAGSWTLTPATPESSNVAGFTLGPTNTLKINEVMANPNGGEDWFELYNPDTNYVHLGGLRWSDQPTVLPATNKPIPQLSFIPPGGFIQFIADDKDADGDHVAFKLGNGGDNLILYAVDRTTVIDRFNFTGQAQANGVSFGRLPDGSTNVVFFAAGRSTPGASNFQLLTSIIFNEVLTHTDPPLEDAIELYNPTSTNVDIGNWWLSNSKDDPKKFRIPAGTTVGPGSYVVFYEGVGAAVGFNRDGTGTDRSFTMNSARGDQIYLHTADSNGNLTFFRTTRDFGPSENGVSFGRYITSEGKTEFTAMSRRSFGRDNPNSVTEFRQGTGLTNPYPKVGPIVIDEIMYHPPDIQGTNDNGLDEYIELRNPGTTNVLLFDPVVYSFADGRTNTWRLRGGVDFNFPTNVVLRPSEYLLVVNFNPQTNLTQLDAFRSKYSIPAGVQIFGPYTGGKLDNANGTIELLKPDPPQDPDLHPQDAGLVPYIRVEKVDYDDDPPWPVQADGSGAALQRVHASGYANDPTNWIAAAASPGGVFVPNTAPIITPMADIETNEMQLIQFFVTATDTNVPAQTLTFSLEPGAPPGARIESNGRFRWSPREEHGTLPPTSYPITVKVTDNGIPPQSSTLTFNIRVREVNRPPSFGIRGQWVGIAEQWVKAGTTLSFETGYDLDVPPQLVQHGIVGPAPAGVSVDLYTGQVTWTPDDQDASTNAYLVTIEGTDDGDPPLTNRRTYTIHVLGSGATLIVADLALVADQVIISWRTTIGKTYSVQYTESLAPANWLPFTEFMSAESDTMSVADSRFNAQQRFYRVIQHD